MAHTMIWGEEMLSRSTDASHDPNQLLDSLIQFAAAGMAAPAAVGVEVGATRPRRRS
jgi:hypothetical protein